MSSSFQVQCMCACAVLIFQVLGTETVPELSEPVSSLFHSPIDAVSNLLSPVSDLLSPVSCPSVILELAIALGPDFYELLQLG